MTDAGDIALIITIGPFTAVMREIKTKRNIARQTAPNRVIYYIDSEIDG